MRNPVSTLKQFYAEVVQEVGKCTWPGRKRLLEHTVLVIVAVGLLSAFVFVVDFIWNQGITGIMELSDYLVNLFS